MNRLPWSLLPFSAALFAGCEQTAARAPLPPIDLAVPSETETATFALG